MAARFCAYCGQPIPANARFCPSCGATVGAAPAPPPAYAPPGASPGAPPPLTFGTGAPYAPYRPAYPVAPAVPSTFGGADRLALSNVRLAAVLGLVGVALSFFTLFLTPALATFTGATTTSSGSSFTLDLTELYVLAAALGVGLALGFLELWFYRQAFRTLEQTDRTFSTPATLTLVAIVALLIIVLAVLALVGVLYQAYVCAGPGGTITSACVDAGTLLGLVVLVGIAAIVLLVGYIGLLIGIWRLGTRYNEGMFKVGAVLLILPLLSVVGLILVLIAAQSARERLGPDSSPFQFGR
jgi:uncharacterized membrane protein